MKKIFFLLLSVISMQTVLAQKKDSCFAGVYLTQEDFIQNKLSHKINTNIKGYDFHIGMTMRIKITSPGSTLKFKKGSVYGYYLCGKKYRYSPNVELLSPEDYYRVEEISGLIIYSSVFWGGSEYFYSTNLSSPVHRLNMKNLENDFKEFLKFIEAVKKMKSENGGDLAAKDKEGNFLINKLYQQYAAK